MPKPIENTHTNTINLHSKNQNQGTIPLNLFGTSGIDGKANTVVRTQLSLQIGQALATNAKAKAILTAHDTRTTSPMLHYAQTAGIAACGAAVLQQGTIPTPVLANLTKQTRAARVRKKSGIDNEKNHETYG